jgi:putative transposase
MNVPKVDELDYINFLIAAQRVFSTVEAARVSPDEQRQPAHDAYTRLLQRTPPDSTALWLEVEPLVKRKSGVLVIDDSTLDKPYARHMALVTRHWSGKHGQVVQGINLVSLVWSDGDARLPCDFRLYHKAQDGLSKNDHFQHMVTQAHQRGFEPEIVAFDSWYASLPNLKLLRDLEWDWLTQLKGNRQVSVDRSGNRALSELIIPVSGLIVHLKGYGWIKVFRTVGTNGDAEYWATSKRRTMRWMPGISRSTIVTRSSSRALNAGSFGWKLRNATTLDWQSIACNDTSLTLKPKPPLSAMPSGLIWLI